MIVVQVHHERLQHLPDALVRQRTHLEHFYALKLLNILLRKRSRIVVPTHVLFVRDYDFLREEVLDLLLFVGFLAGDGSTRLAHALLLGLLQLRNRR